MYVKRQKWKLNLLNDEMEKNDVLMEDLNIGLKLVNILIYCFYEIDRGIEFPHT